MVFLSLFSHYPPKFYHCTIFLTGPLTTLRIKLKLLRHFIQRSNRIIPILIFPHTPYQRRCQEFKDIFNFIQIRIYRKSLVIPHCTINLTGSKDPFCYFVFAFRLQGTPQLHLPIDHSVRFDFLLRPGH